MKFVATGDPAEVDAGKLTLEVVREELAAVVEQRSVDDPHLSYVNGLDLFGPADVGQFPYADNLHPRSTPARRPTGASESVSSPCFYRSGMLSGGGPTG